MRNLIQSRIFALGFFLSYFSFFVVTVFVLDLSSDGLGVGHSQHGFPFTYYYSHCFGGYYVWSGLIGNILFAAIIGTVGGLSASHIGSKVSSPEFRRKWYL